MRFQVSAMLYPESGSQSQAFQSCRASVIRELARGWCFRELVQEFRFAPCLLNRQACYPHRWRLLHCHLLHLIER